MADIIFFKNNNGQIFKLEGDDLIHRFVILKAVKYEGSETVRYVQKKLLLAEPDSCVRDRIMARLFMVPWYLFAGFEVGQISDEQFATLVREMKDHLSYSLFPKAPEFDDRDGYGPGSGGVLLRSLAHVPKNTSTYFLHDWSTTVMPDSGEAVCRRYTFESSLVGSRPLPRSKSW